MQKGKIIDIATYADEFQNEVYRVTIEFAKKPTFKLGECRVKQ